MLRFLTITVIAVGLAAGAAPRATAQQQAPKEVLKETHGAWNIRCVEGTETCAMSQIGKTSDGKQALLVTIQRLQGATSEDGQPVPAAITVQTPLGILLGYGLRLKIDNQETVPLPLGRCIPGGCVAQAPMLDEAVSRMKAGSKAVFGYFMRNEILVDVSLSGFTKAFNSLKPVAARQG